MVETICRLDQFIIWLKSNRETAYNIFPAWLQPSSNPVGPKWKYKIGDGKWKRVLSSLYFKGTIRPKRIDLFISKAF